MASSVLFAALLALSSTAVFVQPAAAVQGLTGWEAGFITHYGGKQDGMQPSNPSFGTKEGACGYGLIPKDQYPYFSVAAFSPSNKFAKAGPLMACGQCFQIQCQADMDGKDICIKDSQGKHKSVLVMISDTCPECEAEHIDVQSLSFAKLANPDIGRIKVTYRRVECAPPQDIQVSVMDFAGSNGWLRLVIKDTGGRGSVKSVSIKSSSSGSWINMRNTWGATWELGSAPTPPLDFVVETENGDQVTAMGVIRQNGGISLGSNGNSPLKFSTGKQFAIDDPAVLQVKAFSGEQDPMLITSDTPGNSGGGASSSSNSNSSSSSSSGGSGVVSVNAGSTDCASYKSDSSINGGNSCGQSCTDVVPKGPTPCSQWKAWGKCSDDWLVKGQFCSATCGRCSNGASSSGVASSSSSSPSPPPKAASSPSPSPKAASSPSPSPKAANSPSPVPKAVSASPSPKASSSPSPSPKAASSPSPSPKASSSPSPSPKASSSPSPSPKASSSASPSPKASSSPSPSPKVASSPPQHSSGRRMLLLWE